MKECCGREREGWVVSSVDAWIWLKEVLGCCKYLLQELHWQRVLGLLRWTVMDAEVKAHGSSSLKSPIVRMIIAIQAVPTSPCNLRNAFGLESSLQHEVWYILTESAVWREAGEAEEALECRPSS